MLTEDEKRVLDVVGYEEVRLLRYMAADAGMSVNRLRQVLRDLRDMDLVSFGTCYNLNDETLRYGSGWSLTRAGYELQGKLR